MTHKRGKKGRKPQPKAPFTPVPKAPPPAPPSPGRLRPFELVQQRYEPVTAEPALDPLRELEALENPRPRRRGGSSLNLLTTALLVSSMLALGGRGRDE